MPRKTNKQFLDVLSESVESIGPRIYKFQSMSVGFFKSLSEFHQNLVLKLLCATSTDLDIILAQSPDLENKLAEIESLLIGRFKIMQKVNSREGKVHFKLEDFFADSIKSFLAKGLETIFPVNTATISKCIKYSSQFEEKLKDHAFKRWNNMHKFMLKKTSHVANIEELPSNIVGALEDSNLLMSKDVVVTQGSNGMNSSSGPSNATCFDFLLDNIKNQVSIFLYAYCKYLFRVKYKYLKGNKRDKEAVSEGNIVNLVFYLTLVFPLISYSLKKSQEALAELELTSDVIHDIMMDLDSVGLLKIKLGDDQKISYFATTPLIHNIFNSNVMLEKGFKNDIIVETDFKIYAYSNNPEYLEALLSLFTEIKFKMPTLLVCSLEEDKIKEAYQRGIEPRQILKYLNSNTHKEVMKTKMYLMTEQEIAEIDDTFAFIPENVVQQMFIWYV